MPRASVILDIAVLLCLPRILMNEVDIQYPLSYTRLPVQVPVGADVPYHRRLITSSDWAKSREVTYVLQCNTETQNMSNVRAAMLF